MSDLSKRRVYVMDCGGFVKIGVSNNAEIRRNQIPYEVKQYYCTEPIENAFETEKFIHKILSPVLDIRAKGREYFDIDFDVACEILNSSLISDEKRKGYVMDAVNTLFRKNQNNQGFDKDFYKFVSIVLKLPPEDLVLIDSFATGLLERRKIIEYKKNAL